MTIKAKFTGDGKLANSSISGYSVTEESTPLDPSDSSGAVGQITVTGDEDFTDSILLLNDRLDLSDGTRGTTTGTVSGVSSNNGNVTVQANSRLGQLVIETSAAPYVGTLDGAFRYYLSLAGISEGVYVDDTIADREVIYPGWGGDLWVHIKQMCAVEQVEVSLVSNNIVLRPPRTFIAQTNNRFSDSWDIQNGELAQAVEIVYYNNVYGIGLAYPSREDIDTKTGQSVNAGETLYLEVSAGASLESVLQPIAQNTVPRGYADDPNMGSVYSVLGKDNKEISASAWTNAGGSITVEILPDSTTLGITIKAPYYGGHDTFKIAAKHGEDYHNSLHIMGEGIFFEPKSLILPTGTPINKGAQPIGTKVDSKFISSIGQALDVGVITAGRYAGPALGIDIETALINRRGEAGTITYPTFADLNALLEGDFDDSDEFFGTSTFGEFTEQMFEYVESDFANQAFGNVAGARHRYRNAWYRIRSASITPTSISYNAEADTTFEEFNAEYEETETFADFTEQMAGKKFEDFTLIPLWRG